MTKNGQLILLKAEEVAEILNISRAMVYRLMRSGEIPAVSIGRSKRILPVDLDGYIHKNKINIE